MARKLIISGMFVMLVAYRQPSVSDAIMVLNVNTTAGESTVLPCTTSSIGLMELRFYWQDEKNDVLYSFNKGKQMPEHVSELYRGRITAFPQNMARGNISVKVNNPTLEDMKTVFKAFVSVLNSRGIMTQALQICQITLHVAVPYKNVSLIVNEEEKTAVCTTQRGFPKPLVRWKLRHLSDDSKHVLDLRDGHTKTVQDAGDHLYNLNSTIDIQGGQYRSVTCLIHNPTLNVTLSETYVFNKGKQLWGFPDSAACLTAAAAVLLVKAVITT